MSILIKGMEMPIDGNETIIRIQPDGTVLDQYGHHLAITAVPVPPHGRLIDADALIKQVKRDGIRSDPFVRIVCDYFKDAPTIFEADRGDNQ